jgi:hypothetical protein
MDALGTKKYEEGGHLKPYKSPASVNIELFLVRWLVCYTVSQSLKDFLNQVKLALMATFFVLKHHLLLIFANQFINLNPNDVSRFNFK